ncbi:hypothetical protein Tb927.6.860 [Trypanosoma brucei brucei TREU927]|uniref:T. brucei spp.-specific protein n=1 Tax=Trypanosoma brucei brucei (strain 927/4 GUTat10.1) TaxID=185431 RepID=Q585G0_TRYB2|nr:hypothetical protein Tb927.6.860 [Trypanosoma brucei brucei TREU927]AAX80342.1 hypothetical protein Tb927.6.860 [Trypanosoma brucei]AAZ11650.1 hypothetical protein Tb927.6.860 [Trypanosoma brucei brucei TREU927]
MHMYNPVEGSKKEIQSSYASSSAEGSRNDVNNNNNGNNNKSNIIDTEPGHDTRRVDSHLLQEINDSGSRCPPLVRLLRTRTVTTKKNGKRTTVSPPPQPQQDQLQEQEQETAESTLNLDDVMPTPIFDGGRDLCFSGMMLPKFTAARSIRKCRTGRTRSSTVVKRVAPKRVERCYSGCKINHGRSNSAISIPACRKNSNRLHRCAVEVDRRYQECTNGCDCNSEAGEIYHEERKENSTCLRCHTTSSRPNTRRNSNSEILSQTPPNTSASGVSKDNCCTSVNVLNDTGGRSRRFTSELYREASTFVLVPPSTANPHGTVSFREQPITCACACACDGRRAKGESARASANTKNGLVPAATRDNAEDERECSNDELEATGLISISELTLGSTGRSMTAMMFVGADHLLPQMGCELLLPSPSTSLSPEYINSPPRSKRSKGLKRANQMKKEFKQQRRLDEPPRADMEMSSPSVSILRGNENDSPSLSSAALYEWNGLGNDQGALDMLRDSRDSLQRAYSELQGGVLCLTDFSRMDNQSLDSRMTRLTGAQAFGLNVKDKHPTVCRPRVVRSPMNFTIVSDAFDPLQHVQELSVLDYGRNGENISPVVERPDAALPFPHPLTPASSYIGSNVPPGRSPSLFTPKRLASHHFHALKGLYSPVDAAASRERIESHSNSINQRYSNQPAQCSANNTKEQPLEWTTRRENSEGVLSQNPDNAPPFFSGLMLNFARLNSEASCASADTIQSASSNNVSNLFLKVYQGMEWGKLQMPAFQLDQQNGGS